MSRFVLLRSVESDSWAVMESTDSGPQLTPYRVRRQPYVHTYALGRIDDDGEDFSMSLEGIFPTPEAALTGLEEWLRTRGP